MGEFLQGRDERAQSGTTSRVCLQHRAGRHRPPLDAHVSSILARMTRVQAAEKAVRGRHDLRLRQCCGRVGPTPGIAPRQGGNTQLRPAEDTSLTALALARLGASRLATRCVQRRHGPWSAGTVPHDIKSNTLFIHVRPWANPTCRRGRGAVRADGGDAADGATAKGFE